MAGRSCGLWIWEVPHGHWFKTIWCVLFEGRDGTNPIKHKYIKVSQWPSHWVRWDGMRIEHRHKTHVAWFSSVYGYCVGALVWSVVFVCIKWFDKMYTISPWLVMFKTFPTSLGVFFLPEWMRFPSQINLCWVFFEPWFALNDEIY
jgi:hypothetical protein